MTKPVKLRRRKPYTCRFEIAGKVCAAYLQDSDTDFCAEHEAAVQRFMKGYSEARATTTDQEPPKLRIIWPCACPEGKCGCGYEAARRKK